MMPNDHPRAFSGRGLRCCSNRLLGQAMTSKSRRESGAAIARTGDRFAPDSLRLPPRRSYWSSWSWAAVVGWPDPVVRVRQFPPLTLLAEPCSEGADARFFSVRRPLSPGLLIVELANLLCVKDFLRGASLPVFLLDPQILQASCYRRPEDKGQKGG